MNNYLANLNNSRYPFRYGKSSGDRGYVPNELIVAHKNLSRFKRKLKSLKELEGNKLLDASDKILHLENLIRKYQTKIENYSS